MPGVKVCHFCPCIAKHSLLAGSALWPGGLCSSGKERGGSRADFAFIKQINRLGKKQLRCGHAFPSPPALVRAGREAGKGHRPHVPSPQLCAGSKGCSQFPVPPHLRRCRGSNGRDKPAATSRDTGGIPERRWGRVPEPNLPGRRARTEAAAGQVRAAPGAGSHGETPPRLQGGRFCLFGISGALRRRVALRPGARDSFPP